MWFTLLAAAALAAPDVFRFASGLRVVAEHRPGTPWMATAMTFAKAGQGDADTGQEQLAHLVEHLWYRVGDHDARLHAMGCEFQAITWPRTMEFLTTCPADAFERQLDLEAAKLTGAFTGLDEGTLGRERDVVAIEIGSYREVDAAVVARAIASQMERDLEVRARLARGGMGAPLDVADVQSFVAGHLTPERAVLAIVSPFPSERLYTLLEDRFGPIVSSEPVGPWPHDPTSARPTLRVDVRTVEAPIDEGLVVATWELPGPLAVTGSSLTGWLEDALWQRVGRDGRFRGVFCTPNVSVSTASVSCWFGLEKTADPMRAARIVRRDLDLRDTLSASLLGRVYDDGRLSGMLRTLASQDELEPMPFNRPARLATVMHLTNAPLADYVPGALSRKERKALLKLAVEAFDPQRALVIAVTPTSSPAPALPAARPAVRTTADVPAIDLPLATPGAWSVHPFPGGLAIGRRDLSITQVMTVDQTGVLDLQPWFGQPLPPTPPGSAQLFIGPRASDVVGTLGTVVLNLPDETVALDISADREEGDVGRGLEPITWSCEAEASAAVLFVGRELLGRRLWHAGRVATAWSYTPQVSALGGTLTAELEVLPDAAAAARSVIDETVAAFAAGTFVDRELALARRRAALRGAPGIALPSHWPELVIGKGRLRTAAELQALPKQIQAIDADAVAAFFGACRASQGPG